MKEEIEMLKEETQDREGKIARLEKNCSHVEQELEFYQE
jgi:prefoldin subunit 5